MQWNHYACYPSYNYVRALQQKSQADNGQDTTRGPKRAPVQLPKKTPPKLLPKKKPALPLHPRSEPSVPKVSSPVKQAITVC